MNVLCTCGKPAELVSGKEVYPHRSDLFQLAFWRCVRCNSYCGCHKGTNNPLGTLANSELRDWRKKCHTNFDQIWKQYGTSRSMAYEWMSTVMGISKSKCHIAMFDVKQCEKLLYEIQQGWERNTLPFLLNRKFHSWITLGDFLPFMDTYYEFIVYKDVIPNKDLSALTKKDKKIELMLEFQSYEGFIKFSNLVFKSY